MILAARLRRLFVHDPPDPVRFWRTRAVEPGWRSVMWKNPFYNELAHHDQWRAILRHLPERREAVLDLGCGTGRLSARLQPIFNKYVGVDLDTMVAEARRRNPGLASEFIASTVQEYAFPPDSFDLVLSMACLASACSAQELPEVARRIVAATRAGGRIVMIDPFHRIPALARTCRLRPHGVIRIFNSLGVALEEWAGIHFIPGRLLLAAGWLARSRIVTVVGYKTGEAVCRLAPRLLSDYSVIAFRKPACMSA